MIESKSYQCYHYKPTLNVGRSFVSLCGFVWCVNEKSMWSRISPYSHFILQVQINQFPITDGAFTRFNQIPQSFSKAVPIRDDLIDTNSQEAVSTFEIAIGLLIWYILLQVWSIFDFGIFQIWGRIHIQLPFRGVRLTNCLFKWEFLKWSLKSTSNSRLE